MIQKVITLYQKIENFWFSFDERLRYLLVGGFNTVFAYLLFCLFFLLMNKITHAEQYALFLQNLISINVSVFTMRYYVFRSHGNFKKEYFKALQVYLVMVGLNAVALFYIPFIFPANPMILQAIWIIFATILTYFLHKYFSFKKIKL